MRSGYALHPKQRERLGWERLPDVEEVEPAYGVCKGCARPLTQRVEHGREPFCTRDCRLLHYGLVDATCTNCGLACAVRPEHADHPYCGDCRSAYKERRVRADA